MLEDTQHTEQTTCCIVGGGPAGMILGYLLARNGVEVTVLEAHKDFDRAFRGDTLHCGIMEILEQMGLVDEVLQLPHAKAHKMLLKSSDVEFPAINFTLLKSKYPFVTLVPQELFLEFMAKKAAEFSGFTLKLSSPMTDLLMEGDRCVGVKYKDEAGQEKELRATLTVAADGRFSRARKKAGLEQKKTSPPMDVLWFKLPREPRDEINFGVRVGPGHIVVVLEREDSYQVGFVIAKGGFHDLKKQSIEKLKEKMRERVPELADRMDCLRDWKDVAVLTVDSGMLEKWHQPGLQFIGDAAHTMSPVGGTGINYAIWDAVVAANELTRPLREGTLSEADLARVQKKRGFPTRVMQRLQTLVQKRILQPVLENTRPFRPPFFFAWPLFRHIPPRMLAYGVRRVKVSEELLQGK